MATAAIKPGFKLDATGFAIAILAHAALLYILTRDRVEEKQPEPPAMEVSFVEEVGPVSSAPTTSAEPAPTFGEEFSPDVASGAEASQPAPITPPVPEPVRPPVQTGERARPDLTQSRVPERPTLRPTPRPSQPQARPQPQRPTPAPQARPQPQRPTPARPQPGPSRPQARPGGGLPSANSFDTSREGQGRQPSAQATGQVRTNIRSIIAAELRNPSCSRQTLPVPEARNIRVTMTVSLGRDGRLEGTSHVVVANNDPELRRYEPRMRELALGLVRCAAPFERLARDYGEYYDSWRRFPYAFPIRN